jgi:hypothetical protein
MPSLLTLLLPVLFAVAALFAGHLDARRLAWLAVIAYALGAASVRVALRLPLGETADPLWIDALPVTSLRIDAGLQLLGAMLAVGSAAVSWTRAKAIHDRVSGLIALVGAGAIVMAALPLLAIAGWSHALAAAVALGAALSILGVGLFLLATRLSQSERSGGPEPGSLFSRTGRGPRYAFLGLGAILALAGPHLHLVIVGAITAALAAYLIARGARRLPLPVFPAVATGALAFVAYYLDVIAGPTGLALAVLPEAPLSPAAQGYLVPALALGAAGFFGFWPFTALTAGTWLAPVGTALLLRIGAESLPLGMEGWRTVAIPLGVIGAWGAALGHRPLALASAGAWMACFAAAAGGEAAAWLLALLPVLGVHLVARPDALARSGRPLIRSAVLVTVGTLGGMLALDALLRTEVVYAVLAAAAAAFSAVYISRAPT